MIQRLLIALLALTWPIASHAASPTLDGHNNGTFSTSITSAAVALTTTGTNRRVFAAINTEQLTHTANNVTSVTGGSLTWTRRAQSQDDYGAHCGGTAQCAADTEIWSACAPTALTAASITMNFASTSGFSTMIVWGIAGVNDCTTTGGSFDGNVALPIYTRDTSGSATQTAVSFTTSNSNDLLVGVTSGANANSATAAQYKPSGFTTIDSNAIGTVGLAVYYKSVSATVNETDAGGEISTHASWTTIGDAMTADSGPASTNRPLVHQTPWMMGR